MKNLKFGMKGEAVAELQRTLNKQGYPIEVTGDFDEATEAALIAYQISKNLLADGICGKDTISSLRGNNITKFLKESDIAEAAKLLNVDIASVKAIVRVESNGSGYLNEDRLRVKILFERHKFYELLHKKDPIKAKQAYRQVPHICNPKTGGYIGGAGEYPRLAQAMNIDPEIGMMSASWGLFQIMGFNHKTAGYPTIHAFVDAMKESEGKQLLAFANFVIANKTMHTALQKRDWATFAKLYNGPAYKKNNYDSKLANAYTRYQS